MSNFLMASIFRGASILMLIMAASDYKDENYGKTALTIIAFAWNWEAANRRSRMWSGYGKKGE